MSTQRQEPKIGQIVRVTQGRDAGQYAVIIEILDHRYVLLADGEKRKYHCPKKKNIQHVKLIDYISPEIKQSLKETGRVTNGKLRYAKNLFTKEVVTDKQKGDKVDGKRRRY